MKHFQHEKTAIFPKSGRSDFLDWIKVTAINTYQKGNWIQA